MIHTSRQLKALVRNMSKGNSTKAQVIIRNYVMERFLERLSLSKYRNNFILKGGALVAAMVGIDNRSTMDIDATIKNLHLNEETAKKIVEEIVAIQIDDGMVFEITGISTIMDEDDYQGIRVMINTSFETMRTPLKIDFSTGDLITPSEVTYSFRLLFEDRTISILAYNLETILAEKIETMISRGTANTRMRDFYDLFVLKSSQSHNIDGNLLKIALANTSKKRFTTITNSDIELILDEITNSPEIKNLWKGYQNKFEYASDIEWDEIMRVIKSLCDECIN